MSSRVNQDDRLAEAVAALNHGDLDGARKLAEEGAAVHATAPWQHLLGLVHCRRGDAAAGVPHLRAAVRLEPANLGLVVMLARALINSGRPQDVLAMAKPAGTSPAALALWHSRAEAAAAMGDALAEVDAWTNIASATQTDARAWVNLGRSLLKLNEFEQAQSAYERALALSPGSIEAVEELGLIYERTNQLEALGALLDRMGGRGIGKDQLSYLWALRLYRQGQIGEAREHLLSSSPARDPVRWHRLRANIADKEGDAATAFAELVEVNQRSEGIDAWRERAREFRGGLRQLAAWITSGDASQLQGIRPADQPGPAFIVGFPRSGTTLLDTFLLGHSSIAVLEEKEMLREAARQLGTPGLSAEWAPALERARSEYLRLLCEHTGSNPEAVVIDKDPLNMLAPHLILAMFPQSPIIFVQRHPCDAVLSGFMQSFTPNLGMANFLDLSDAADFYDAAMTVWTAATATLPLNVRTVVYEDLVQEPEQQLRPLIEFLGLDWEDGLLDHRATAAARGAIMNTSYNQVTERLSTAAIGRWRGYEKELEEVFPRLLPWVKRLGY